jgi:predicted permease
MGAVRTVEGQDWRAARNASNVWLIGRLRPGLTQRQAEVSLSVQAAELAREYPTTDDDLQIRLSAPGLFGNRLRGAAWGLGTVLLAVAGLTLLTACTNMAAIEMAQISDRRRELATRVALGARSAALVRIVLLESLVTAVLAGCVAVAVAWWLWSGVTSALPAFEFPIQSELAFDWRLILFGVVVVAASALLVGLIPALRAGRADPIFTMKNEPARLHRGRIELRRLYVSLQVAVSVVLTGAAFLMIATLKDALTMDVGFDPHHVFVLRYDLDMYRYTPERGQRFQKLLLDRAGAMPGVVSASLSSSIPFSIDQSTTAVTVEGTPAVSAGKLPSALLYSAEPAFFRTMGIRLTRGRDFDSNDRADTPRVAIVNRTLAASLLRGRDPIGQRLKLGVNGELVSVVGVAEAGKYRSIHEDAQFAIWLPMAQRYNGTNALVVRWAPQRPLTLESLESLINGLAPELLVFDARPIDRFLDLALTPLRLTLEALLAMAGLAVFLSAAGLYAMLKHDATRRTREIGIRLALGATKRDILLLVSRRTCVTVAASTIAGAAVASFLLRYLGAQFGTSLSLSVIALAAVSVLIVGIVAALLPAVRATGILPSSALRHEI